MRREALLGASAVAALAPALAARVSLLLVEVLGDSMVPTFQSGDRVLAMRRWTYRRVHVGDVVVCRMPAVLAGSADLLLVKRVAALAGQLPPRATGSKVVPDGHIYVLGDSSYSTDSAQFGPIPESHVLGRVLMR